MPHERFPVLMYHAVSRVEGRLRPLGVPSDLLADQLSLLRGEGYELLGLSEALEVGESAPERKIVALTFDDAYEDFLEGALPVLGDLGARATLYVPTAYVGAEASWLGTNASAVSRVLDWEQLGECVSSGLVEIGSHGRSHAPLDTLPARSLVAETAGSRAALESKLHVPVKSFCYPHGYHSAVVRSAVRGAGFENACEVGRRLRSDEHRWSISRLAVGPDDQPEKLLRDIQRGGPIVVPTVKRALQPAWRQLRRLRLSPAQAVTT